MLSLVMVLSFSVPSFAASITSTQSGSNTASSDVKANYTPTPDEAIWGVSADDLKIGSGTLKEAIDAAEENSNVKYIMLKENVTTENGFNITDGTFTLDLNSCVVSSPSIVFFVFGEDVDVTFTDSSEGKNGKVATSGTATNAVVASEGKATFNEGKYESNYSTVALVSTSASVEINGGTFTATSGWAVDNSFGTLVINGGTFTGMETAVNSGSNSISTTVNGGEFTEGYNGQFTYGAGKLDFSGFTGTLAGITVYNSVADLEVGDSTIKLPTGYGFSTDNTNVVTTLTAYTKYTIISAGSTTPETKAVITGVSITVDGTLYTTGNVTIKPTSGNVTLTVSGTNLSEEGGADAKVYFASGVSDSLSSGWWEFNDEKTTASRTVKVSNFDDTTTAYEIKYSNDGGTNLTNTGIYVIYQAETTSVEITWGSMTFTYSDEQVSGADKGWTCEDGSNKVTVKNSGTVKVKADVVYTPEADYSTITGSFDVSSATLSKDDSAADFLLTLSGKPEKSLDNEIIGKITVTITKATD